MQPATPFTTRDLLPPFLRAFAPVLDAATGLKTLQQLYDSVDGGDPRAFVELALHTLAIGVTVADDELSRIPKTGPLIIAANHPHGMADGLALAHAVRRVRTDVRLLGNELLTRIPEMAPHLIAVDAFRTGRGANRQAMRAAIGWLRDGHALIVFPAGEVSHTRTGDGRVVDGAWRDGIARLAAGADASIVPAFIDGANSPWFLTAGRAHPMLRTALLPSELLRLRRRTLSLRIGRPISARRLLALQDVAAQTAYVRALTYGLAPGIAVRGTLRRLSRRATAQPVAPETAASLIRAEIARLPPEARLLESGDWVVYCADAAEVPHGLLEIGRLREMTFRATGEGTGRSRDLDRFDRHYRHLFVWHRTRELIAGAYRVGPTDRILGAHGLSGLYTRTLFRYPTGLMQQLGPALELGRSFVRSEFQREYQPLLLLWRGIGQLVVREPRYRVLFGPVSISAEYGAMTRQLLARFLLTSRYSPELGSLVRPRRPLPSDPRDGAEALVRSTVASSLDDVDAIVRELEAGQRGMPVLLRQYLKLNAKLLGFSVDPAFGHVLDGLVVVDLLDVGPMLARYLGKDGAARFTAYHRPRAAAALEPAIA